MKVIKVIICLLATSLLAAALFFSCTPNEGIGGGVQQYSVSFDTDGGTEIEAQTVTVGTTAAKPLITPQKEGYTFKGWYYTNSKGKEAEYQFSVAVTSNLTIKAKYVPNTYTIYFDKSVAQGNAGVMPAMVCTYDQEYSLPKNTFTSIGQTFTGWAVGDPYKKTYDDEQTIKNLSIENGAMINLYAVWEDNPYHIVTYNTNGGKIVDLFLRKYIETQEFNLAIPERTGYNFAGWYEDKNFSGTPITGWSPGERTTDLTVWAKWVPNTYTITLNDRDTTSSYLLEYNSFLHTYTVPEIDGATFGGFYTLPYGAGLQYINASGQGLTPYTKTDDLTLYALWSYSITYEGVTDGANPNPSSYTGEREIELQDLICKDGYEFLGWSDEQGDDIKTIHMGSSGKRKFTSNGVRLVEYTITYEQNGGEWDTQDGGYEPQTTYSYLSETIYLPTGFDILRTNYEFKGWYKEPDFSGNKIETIEKNSYGNLVLYAKWQEIE